MAKLPLLAHCRHPQQPVSAVSDLRTLLIAFCLNQRGQVTSAFGTQQTSATASVRCEREADTANTLLCELSRGRSTTHYI